MNFAEQFKKLRDDSGLTQKELADQLNVKQQAISQYENGLAMPKIDMVVQFAEIFNVPLGYLISGIGDTCNKNLTEDAQNLLEIYDSLPNDKKNISLELLKVLREGGEK